ncbi:MFS transporter [Frankia sp. R43]|uniref:MFS transporter n=1 Tax=Frankia sp. R43 TaxID=269536 RepID=UPI0007C84900|nr:MFS transporter [Frankia sp. R43]
MSGAFRAAPTARALPVAHGYRQPVRAPGPATYPSAASPNVVLAVMSACVVLVVGMVAAVNLAVPDIAASGLHPSAAALLWIVDMYVIVFACLLIPAGAVGDRFGRRGTLLVGLAVFALGGAVSAGAPVVAVMLVGRAVTGAAAACILTSTLALIINVFPVERRQAAVGTWAAMTGVGGVVGNAAGGLAVQLGSWRALFAAVVPIALLLLVLAARTTPNPPRQPHPLDVAGTVGLTASFLALLYGIIEGPDRGWVTVPVLGAFTFAAAGLTGWTWYELRRAHPLLDPRVFAIPRLRAATLGMLVAFFGLYALFYVNAQYLQYGKGYSVLVAGLGIVPMAVAMVVVAQVSVGLGDRIGHRAVAGLALGSIVAGLLLLSTATPDTPYRLYVIFLLVVAAGCGLALPALSNGIVHALPPAKAGVAAGINSTARELGSALGVAAVGTVMVSRFTGQLPAVLRDPAGGSTPRTVSAALARLDAEGTGAGAGAVPDAHAAVVQAFTSGMDTGLRVVAVIVLVAAIAVVTWHPSRKAREPVRR